MAYLGFGKGGYGERAEHEPITGVWGRSPQRGPEAEPMVGGQGGRSPPKAETFFTFERLMEATNSPNSCWIMAKNAPFHVKSPVKNFHGWAKGGASHRAPLKYATVYKL